MIASAATPPPTRAQQEAAFLRTVTTKGNPIYATGDLMKMTGAHVAYDCDVDQVIRDGVILANCGGEAEPTDLFVELPTKGLHPGKKLRVLGIMERPASWSDLTGHIVYYAFLRAVYVDPRK